MKERIKRAAQNLSESESNHHALCDREKLDFRLRGGRREGEEAIGAALTSTPI